MKDFEAGKYIQNNTYKAFQPSLINRPYHFDQTDLLSLYEKASRKLGELSAYSDLVPDIDLFIKMHIFKEATLSSRIEGTRTNIDEALMNEEDINPEKRNDWKEVNNYVEAMNYGVEQLNRIPISSRLLKEMHSILLQGVRGEHKSPCEFRRSQNWIGGASIASAYFIPPVWEEVNKLMGDLENFLHNDKTGLPPILRIALAHYQFETIHPFLDGNGRIGRSLFTLYFVSTSILRKPVLYLSEYFEMNRDLYYQNLMKVRTENDLNNWYRFVLTGIEQTCDNAIQGLRTIISIKQDCETQLLPKLGRKMHKGNKLLTYLFSNPVVKAEDVSQATGLTKVSSYKLINDFEKLGILKEITGNQRNKLYIFNKYVELF